MTNQTSKRNHDSTLSDKVIRARLLMLWIRVRDSLWFVPAVLTVSGALLAILLVQLERSGIVPWPTRAEQWLLAGDADGSRQLLSAIAGGLMTVTGVAFSVTIVAIQLASSQFTPRVLRNFSADRANQLVLGVLIGTFTYAMLVLRTIRASSDDTDGFVPQLAVAVGVLLALLSIGWLIYFINHMAASMRVSVILERVTTETLRHVREYFPEPFGASRTSRAVVGDPAAGAQAVPTPRAGYLQAVDSASLHDFAAQHDLTVRMGCDIGQFLLAGQPLAWVTPAEAIDDGAIRHMCKAFVIGEERTPKQDIEFGIVEIADIAIKALSPGINDPTTAMRCIDRLTEILQELGCRSAPADAQLADGRAPFIARHLEFSSAVAVAFDQIRHFGASNPAIGDKLLDSVGSLIGLLPAERHAALLEQADAVLEDTCRSVEGNAARRDLDRLREKHALAHARARR